jgi:hypothetical protein
MRRQPVQSVGLVFFLALIAAAETAGSHALGEEPPAVADEVAERTARLDEMAKIIGSIQVVALDDQGQRVPAVMTKEPLHRWTDPTREFSVGSLWVWRTSGRPVAVVGIELYAWWSLEFISLSTGLVKADSDRAHWAPRKPGVEFHEIPDAPVPAASEGARLRQMREQIKRFTAREYWVNGNGNHYVLRLLPHPIDRYSDAAAGVIDGGLFIYANGTNPEMLVMIEAQRNGDGPPKWSFAAAPFSHAELALKLGTRDVWTCPSKDPGPPTTPNDTYYDLLTPPSSAVRSPPRARPQ